MIESWDGGGAHATDGDAPDTITIKVAGGPKLLHASFAVMENCVQSYPDTGLWASHPARTGAATYIKGGQYGQSLYVAALTFPHTEDSAVLEFTGTLKENMLENRNSTNECWALGGVVVSAIAQSPAPLDGKGFQQRWSSYLARPFSAS